MDTLIGQAAVFWDGSPGTEYVLYDDGDTRVVERIARHAFDDTLARNDDVACLWNHDVNRCLGRTSNGTLRLWTTNTGLWFRCQLPDTTPGQTVETLGKRGDLDGCSFGFVVEEDAWIESQQSSRRSLFIRQILRVKLLDVGPATFPAYSGTTLVI